MNTSNRSLFVAKLFMALMKRIFQAGVVIPSVMIGAAIAVAAVTGHPPVKIFMNGLFEFAEDSIRPAPAWHVVFESCPESEVVAMDRDEAGLYSPPPFCSKEEMVQHVVPATQVVERTASFLSVAYYFLTCASLLFMWMGMGTRRFFGLYPTRQTPADGLVIRGSSESVRAKEDK